MAREPKIEFVVDSTRVIVDFETLTQDKVEDLEEKVMTIRRQQSIYYKHPMEPGETNDQWKERVSKESESEYLRQEGETVDAHLKRMFDSQEGKNTLLNILNAVVTVFQGADKVFSAEQVKKTNPIKLKRFLYDVLTQCGVPAGDLRQPELGK